MDSPSTIWFGPFRMLVEQVLSVAGLGDSVRSAAQPHRSFRIGEGPSSWRAFFFPADMGLGAIGCGGSVSRARNTPKNDQKAHTKNATSRLKPSAYAPSHECINFTVRQLPGPARDAHVNGCRQAAQEDE